MRFAILFTFIFYLQAVSGFNQIVIWGHKLHTHTHSYIHFGFYKGFNSLGFKTLWLDERDDLSSIDFSNTLFITEHQVDQAIPLREDCYYVVHNSSDKKYDELKKNHRFINLQVYKNKYLNSDTLIQVEPYIFYDVNQCSLIFPWATDLLPYEIEKNKSELKQKFRRKKKNKNIVYWIGSIGSGKWGNIEQISPFMAACKDYGVKFIHYSPWHRPISMEDSQQLIKKSFLAPAICGTQQLIDDYIPCRIFKNISYGHFSGTNSLAVYKLFNKKIIYDSNCYTLFIKMKEKNLKGSLEELFELMDFVKNHHTYVNRCEHLLYFISLIKQKYSTQNTF